MHRRSAYPCSWQQTKYCNFSGGFFHVINTHDYITFFRFLKSSFENIPEIFF